MIKMLKIFQKEKGYILDDCEYCEGMYKKSKTCGNCDKKICVSCYKENKLCISCDEEYTEWVNSLHKLKEQKDKEKKYNVEKKDNDLELDLLI
jgi:hypothetical protein